MALGEPRNKKSAVQTEIRRKGGGVENPFQMECGSSIMIFTLL